jgi:hypothetical protein
MASVPAIVYFFTRTQPVISAGSTPIDHAKAGLFSQSLRLHIPHSLSATADHPPSKAGFPHSQE